MTTFAAVRKNYGRLLTPEIQLLEEACAAAAASGDEAAAAAASAAAALVSENAAAATLADAIPLATLQATVAASADFAAFKTAIAAL